jgi:hypothetical protein
MWIVQSDANVNRCVGRFQQFSDQAYLVLPCQSFPIMRAGAVERMLGSISYTKRRPD